MTSYVTPIKNSAFIMYIALPSQGNPNLMQASPTLASGDFKVSIDGGALTNLATLPTVTPAAGKMVKISLSGSEMNGDNITVVCFDAVGSEWRDVVINIQTSARQIDDLATSSAITTLQSDTDDIQTRLPSALVSGRIDASVGAVATAAITAGAIATDAIGAAELATDAVTEIANAVWDTVASSHLTAGTYGQVLQPMRASTAQAGVAGTITLDASASATNSLYNGCIIAITSGTGAGQTRLITAYVGATKVASITPNWTTNPDSTSIFVILPYGYVAGLVSAVSGAITTSSFAAGAIDAAAIADGAIDAATFAAGAINAAAIATDAITAAKIAADAIGASELAADAVTEIQSGLATSSALATVQADTDDIQTRLPAALVGGRIDSSVGAMASAVVTAAAIATDAIGAAELAADAVTEIANAVWDTATSAHTTSGTYGQAIQPVRTATAQAGAAGTITLDASASATDDFYKGETIYIVGSTGIGQARIITSYVGSTKVATIQPNWVTNPSSSSVFIIVPTAHSLLAANAIQAIWDALTSALTTAGSIGKLLVDNINGTITSRMATFTYTAPDNATITAINAKTTNLPSDPADASDVAAAISALNNISVANILAGVVEGSYTIKDALRLGLAVLSGKSSGGGTTTVKFRDTGDAKDRVTATVDSNGNRTAVTIDVT